MQIQDFSNLDKNDVHTRNRKKDKSQEETGSGD